MKVKVVVSACGRTATLNSNLANRRTQELCESQGGRLCMWTYSNIELELGKSQRSGAV